jgi:hypothetical protein
MAVRRYAYDPLMAKPLCRWNIYLVQAKGGWLGEIEPDAAEEAIKVASERFGQEAKRLMAVRRG